MEKYKSKLKMQNTVFISGILLLIAVQVLAFCQIIKPVAADERWASGWNGFIAGGSLSMMVMFIVGLVVNLRALRSETALKKLYAREHDERTQQIVRRSQSMGVEIYLMGMLPVIIVCGYFSITVALTCLACEVGLALIVIAAKLYWNHRL